MPPTGQLLEPQDPVGLLTSTTSPVQTVAGSDVLMSALFSNSAKVAHRIYACSTGNLAMKKINDAAFVVFPVFAGNFYDGRYIAVGGTGSGSDSGMTWIAEI